MKKKIIKYILLIAVIISLVITVRYSLCEDDNENNVENIIVETGEVVGVVNEKSSETSITENISNENFVENFNNEITTGNIETEGENSELNKNVVQGNTIANVISNTIKEDPIDNSITNTITEFTVGNYVYNEGIMAASSDDEELETEYIYFDLNAGDVKISGTTYTGYIFVDGESTTVTGKNSTNKNYYIYQSTESNKTTTGLVNGKYVIPEYPKVEYNGQLWSEYITNNSSVEDVITNWETAVAETGRAATGNKIEISGVTTTVVFDNLYSTFKNNSKTDGPVKVTGLGNNKIVTIKLKGDSRFRNIYYNNSSKNGSKLVIDNFDENNPYSGSMTVAALGTNMTRDNKTDWTDCLAVIGASDTAEYGLTFSGGTVFAGFPAQNNRVWNDRGSVAYATCVGGGNNKPGEITIDGGRLTAVSNGTSPAIGGGGGYSLTGDPGIVNVSKGEVYAYSFGIYSIYSGRLGFVPTTTIGGASTFAGAAKDGTSINITGGYVYAESLGGTAIGGGNSRNGQGGDATINISGDATVEARSLSGTVFKNQELTETYDVSAGTAIGGGVGTVGGAAEIKIEGGTITTGSLGGGTGTTKNGSATVTITGGDISGQFIMQSGSSSNCTFTMSGGKIHSVNTTEVTDKIEYVYEDGGALWMDDPAGIAEISAGTIEKCTAKNGGAIYMTGGTFTIKGSGTITTNEATNAGGGIYLGSGKVIVEGGTISSNKSAQIGGGLYLGGGSLNMSGGIFNANTSNNGAGAYITNGEFNLTGGGFTKNEATNNGGAFYVVDCSSVNISNGTITGNTAKNGGAFYQTQNESETKTILQGSCLINSNEVTNGNGGAVYVDGGSTFRFIGGKITYNYAYGKPENSPSAKNSSTGVGGGIYILKGNFSMYDDDDNKGNGAIYGNAADYAADDLFAFGENTYFDAIKVTEMELDNAYADSDSWFEDYPEGEIHTSLTAGDQKEITSFGRYSYCKNSEEKIVLATTVLERYCPDYICITMGYSFGSLLMKVKDRNVQSDQIFIYNIEYIQKNSADKYHLNLDIPVGEEGTQVDELLAGEYKITLETPWSWRYGDKVVPSIIEDGSSLVLDKANSFVIKIYSKQTTEVETSYTISNKKMWLTKFISDVRK